jgi:gas vesicle protein
MENNQRRGSATVAFLIGAVAGGVAALLLAPQSGAETRNRLKRGARDLREKGADLKLRGEERAATVTSVIRDAVSDAKHSYRDEIDKQRESRAASGHETKRSVETDLGGIKPRTGAQS